MKIKKLFQKGGRREVGKSMWPQKSLVDLKPKVYMLTLLSDLYSTIFTPRPPSLDTADYSPHPISKQIGDVPNSF